MKKIFSMICLVFIVLSQFQVLQVYAQGEAELAAEKQKGEQTLDAVEQVIDIAVEKIDGKLGNNTQKKQQLEKKQEEIHEYLEEVQTDISEESNSEEIKEKVEKAKKVVVLKVVSGVTEYEDVEDSIDSEVADTPAEIEEALETIQESMETESGDYSIIVQTRKTETETAKIFATFDANTRVVFMYGADGENYFEVFLEEDSIFRQEMLEDIESGILPENFLGVEIVQPEVFGINKLSLQGEDLSQTWGVEEYKSYKYIESQKGSSQKITVGVVDTGIDYNHPDLKDNVNRSLGKDFVNDDEDAWDDQGHGTHVAGTIAANINGAGIIGVNPYVELVPLKICTERGFCPSYAVLRALDYAKTQKIDILNMSLGGRGTPEGHAICGAISSVVDAGGIVVAASGNANINTNRFVPGGCQEAITVAAVDESGNRAPFSNYGDKVDVAAPGVQVYSTYPTNKGNYRKLSGTSMATPHIAGIVSLMQSHDSDITASKVKTALKKYTSVVKTDRSDKTIAAGVNLEALMQSYAPVKEVVSEEEEASKDFKIRYIRDHGDGSEKNANMHWVEIQAFEKTTGNNVALGKQVTGKEQEISYRPYSRVTDGILSSGTYTEGPATKANWVQVDLGKLYDIDSINIKHYYADGRTYNKTKTEVSADGVNWIVLHDSAVDGTYAEAKDGSGRTYKVEQKEKAPVSKDAIRYIRDWSNGSSANAWNFWIEMKAIEKGTGENVALGKKVTGSIPAYSSRPYSRITDGKYGYGNTIYTHPESHSKKTYVTLDLGKLYDIEEVNIAHYYHDGRTFKETKTEVSADGVNWVVLHDSAVDGTYAEPKDGSGRTYLVQQGEKTEQKAVEEKVVEKEIPKQEAKKEEIVVPVVIEKEEAPKVQPKQEAEAPKDETILLEALSVDPSIAGDKAGVYQQDEVSGEGDEDFEERTLGLTSIPLLLGGEGIDINSSEEFEYITEDTPLVITQGNEREYNEVPKRQVYDEDGKVLSENIEINSSDQKETTGEAFDGELDLYNLVEKPRTPGAFNISSVDEEGETQELFIDGAQSELGISSDEGEDIVFFTGALNQEGGEIVDQDGSILELSSSEIIDVVEELQSEHQDIILIDGAQVGLELSSSEQESIEELELDEYNPEEDFTAEIEGPVIEGYDSEETSPRDDESGELEVQEIEELVEEIESVEYQTELFIDVVEAGIEINTNGGEELREEIELDEYIPDADTDTVGPAIEGYDSGGESSQEEDKLEEEAGEEEIQEVEQVIEDIEEFEYSPEAFFIDGAEAGIEINSVEESVGEEDLSEHDPKEFNEEFAIDVGTIETPQELQDHPDFVKESELGEDEFIEIEAEEVSEDELNSDQGEDTGNIGIQNTYYCDLPSIFLHCNIDVYKGYEYDFKGSDVNKVNIFAGRYETNIKIKEITGKTLTYKLYKNGVYYHTIYVRTPPVKVQNVKVVIGKELKVYFPQGSVYSGQKDHFFKDVVSRLYNHNSHYVRIYGKSLGEMRYHIFKAGSLDTQYIVNVTVVPPPPINIYATVTEGKKVISAMSDARYHEFSFSDSSLATFQWGYNEVYITGKKTGTLKIYAKRDGAHRYTIHVTIKAAPKPKEYSATVAEGKDIRIYFPDKSNASYLAEYKNTGRATVYNSSGYISVKGTTYGDIKYYIKDVNGVIKYIVNLKITPKPPIVISMSMYEGQKVSSYLRHASLQTMSVSKSGHASLSSTSSYLHVTGNKAGNFKIYAKREGIHRYTVHVTVKAKPKVISYSATVQEGKETRIYLPGKFNYAFYNLGAPNGIASLYNHGTSGYVRIVAQRPGKLSYAIKDADNQHRYTLNINIIAIPPTLKTLSLYESRYFSFSDHQYFRPTVSKTGIARPYYNANYSRIEALKAGVVDVYLKDAAGNHRYTYRVTVKVKPKPKIYSLSILSGQSQTLYLPEDISKYTVHGTGANIFDKQSQNGKQLYFSTRTVGKYTLTFIDKTTGFPKYIVNVESKASESNYSIHVTDEIDVWGHDSYTKIVVDPSIVDYNLNGNRSTLRGKKAGKTDVKIYKNGGLRKIWHVSVKDIPNPQTIKCTTDVGKDCDFRIPNDGYYYHQSKVDLTIIESTTKSIEVTGKSSGTIKVYVRSVVGNYITHILEVTVRAKQPKQFDCIVPVGLTCSGVWHEVEDYSYIASNTSLVELRKVHEYKRNTDTKQDEKTGREGLSIIGKKAGNTSVYVFVRGDHYATIKTQVIPAVGPIETNGGNVKVKVKEGNTEKFEITQGGGEYRVLYSDTKVHNFTITKQSGVKADVTVEGKNVGRDYVIIEDKHRQQKGIQIAVEDTELILSVHTNDLTLGQVEYINVLESYKGIKSIIPSNDNILAQAVQDNAGGVSIKITAKKPGVTILNVRDYEDNLVTLRFSIQGSAPLPKNSLNLITNGTFEGSGLRNTQSIGWLGSQENGWSARVSTNNARAEIKNGQLELEVQNKSYIQARNIIGGHYDVKAESIAVTPNTQYKISYEYETQYISGDSKHGFNMYILFQGKNKDNAGAYTQNFIKTSRGKTRVEYDFFTPSGANYLNISPLLYGHTGHGTLHMKAWVDNISLIKVENNEIKAKQDVATEGVRYIRDWAHGSNKNAGSHWVELKALNASGTNIAEGKSVSSNWGDHPSRKISRFTDGNTATRAYTGVSKKLPTYLQVDLGKTYDIEKVQVMHYYHDGRTYKATKTEVSADGVNWMTLHDSAVSGTYAEPKDGSGRTYEVDIEESSDEGVKDIEIPAELVDELRKLFEELGLDYDGIEVAQSSAGGGSPNDIYGPEFCKYESYFECQEKFRLQKATDRDERIITEYLSGKIDKFLITASNEGRLSAIEQYLESTRHTIPDKSVAVYNVLYTAVKVKQNEEAYLKGVQDGLTQNGFYDIAVGLVSGAVAEEVVKKLIKEYPTGMGKQLIKKLGPYVGWGLAAVTLTSAGVVNKDYMLSCLGDKDVNGQKPQYYCGKMTANTILVLGGVSAGTIIAKNGYKPGSFTHTKIRKSFETGNFASGKLDSHYEDHVKKRSEWSPVISKDEYLLKSRNLLSSEPDNNIIEHIDKDNFMFKYNKTSGEFAIGKPDGTIVTFYKPTRGYEYMQEQIIKYP